MQIEVHTINKGKTDAWIDMYDIDLARNFAKIQDCAELYIDEKLFEKYIRGRIVDK